MRLHQQGIYPLCSITHRTRAAKHIPCMKLIADKEVSSFPISAETIKGVVHLTGTADARTEAGKAAAIACGVAGVKPVVNEIRVK
jgi:osmotically-inducible protein OsmY